MAFKLKTQLRARCTAPAAQHPKILHGRQRNLLSIVSDDHVYWRIPSFTLQNHTQFVANGILKCGHRIVFHVRESVEPSNHNQFLIDSLWNSFTFHRCHKLRSAGHCSNTWWNQIWSGNGMRNRLFGCNSKVSFCAIFVKMLLIARVHAAHTLKFSQGNSLRRTWDSDRILCVCMSWDMVNGWWEMIDLRTVTSDWLFCLRFDMRLAIFTTARKEQF